jgi:peptide chain release factor 2
MKSRTEIDKQSSELGERLKLLEAPLNLDKAQDRLKELQHQSSDQKFWEDREKAQVVLREQTQLEKLLREYSGAQRDWQEVRELLGLIESDEDPLLIDLEQKHLGLEKIIKQLEFRRMFQHEADPNNAILTINSGAGGTESQDWVSILLRMYLRWCERNSMTATVVDVLPGEEAGYKNVTLTVEGSYAYGFLKAEVGVHRLVRISPFDANARRHTSFASVFVIPQVADDIKIDIKDADLRIDTYRASGAGGQHVNKTDSAVRITHIPTGIVVQCQNERSQHKNRSTCMKLLQSKLYERELEERTKSMDVFHKNKKDIAWGSQIRSYVMQPYQLVKDHRTKLESGNVAAVLDGEITPFIEAFLLQGDKPIEPDKNDKDLD